MTIGSRGLPAIARAVLAACFLLALVAGPAQAQAPPLTLTGENLDEPPNEGGTPVSASCNPLLGGPSSGSFQTSGIALGPYPGTYTESGTFTVPTGPRTSFAPASAFESTFRIESGSTIVTGTKTFVSGNGRCEDDFGGGRDGVELFAIVEYEARIDTPNGDFSDSGTAQVVVQDRQTTPVSPARLDEHIELFESGLESPLPIDDPPPPPPPPPPPLPGECDDDGDDGFTDDDCEDDDDGGGDG